MYLSEAKFEGDIFLAFVIDVRSKSYGLATGVRGPF